MTAMWQSWKERELAQMRRPYRLALTAAQDAGDASAEGAGRVRWVESDWREACAVANRVYRGTIKL